MFEMKHIAFTLAAFIAIAFASCSAPVQSAQSTMAPVQAAAPVPAPDAKPDLFIDFALNVAEPQAGSYFSFKGPIRYMAADKDSFDAASGASAKNSTEMFMPYLYDVKGKNVLPGGLRNLFLFAVAGNEQAKLDKLDVSKGADGAITIQYVHRGTAYMLKSDASGKFTFPQAMAKTRAIGDIVGAGPQFIHPDFSADNSAAGVDYAKVWDASVQGGKEIQNPKVEAGKYKKTGAIVDDLASPESMFYFYGSLQGSFEGGMLKVSGELFALKR
jgi:hypothetical protein